MLSRAYHRGRWNQPDGRPLGHHLRLVVLQPKSRGWVRLADSDPTSMPLINPNFMGEEEDLRAPVDSVRAVRKVMAQESLAPIIAEEIASSRTPRSANG
jgi:choline dehydrogenase-like flavoprotein